MTLKPTARLVCLESLPERVPGSPGTAQEGSQEIQGGLGVMLKWLGPPGPPGLPPEPSQPSSPLSTTPLLYPGGSPSPPPLYLGDPPWPPFKEPLSLEPRLPYGPQSPTARLFCLESLPEKVPGSPGTAQEESQEIQGGPGVMLKWLGPPGPPGLPPEPSQPSSP